MEREFSERFLRTTSSATTEDVQTPQSILHAAFDAIIQGDFDAFGRSVADDVELSIRGLGELDGSWLIESMIAQGDSIAVLLRESGVFKSNGEAYRVRGVQWFTFFSGKIKRIDEIIAHHPNAVG